MPAEDWGLPPTADIDAIVADLQILLPPGQVTEMRALDVQMPDDRQPHVSSGFYNEQRPLATAALQLTPNSQGVYLILNPVDPDLLSRSANHMQPASRHPAATDADITSRRFIQIDIDPVRPSGISSNDAEHNAAHDRAAEVQEWLDGRAWAEPVVMGTGNGVHLIYPIELPTDDSGLVRQTLTALATQFDDNVVHVDQQTHRPAQLARVPGTWNRKGDDLPERPHRLVQILSAPAKRNPVRRQLIEQLAASVPLPAARQRGGLSRGTFDLDGWIARHDLQVDGPRDWQGGRRWVFRVCPWNPEHRNASAFIVQLASGAIAAGCHHNSCRGNGWHQLRDSVEPGWGSSRRRSPRLDLPGSTHPAVRRAFERAATSQQ